MNKFKKIAVAAVSTVMAGTMALSLAACNPENSDGPGNTGTTIDSAAIEKLVKHMEDSRSQVRENTMATGWTTAKDYWGYLSANKSATLKDEYGVLNSDGSINYNAYNRDSTVTLNLAVGHNSKLTSTFFHDLGDQITLPDGRTYEDDDLKPAWRQMGEDLHITFNEEYHGWASNANLTKILAKEDKSDYANVDLFTSDLSLVVDAVAKNTANVLNLAQYLDYMPNFKTFIEENPIVYLSLLQAGMDTTTGDGRALYVAPYFDGNDDIERYCIMRHDWVEKLLNGTTALEGGAAFKDACGESVSASAFMDVKGKVSIDSTNSAGTGTVVIVKNYDAALAAAKDTNTPLGKAYNDIAGSAYNSESGNIIDIMNIALKANNAATGSQLVSLFRAYIDVCFQKEDGSAYYTSANRADLFNGYDACWDVDDLVALLRCAKTNAVTLTGSADIPVEGIVPRTGQNDRTPDMVRLACQLYGVRGADSRYEYTYIDKDGNLQDARNDKEFYEAFARLNTLKQEKLVADYSGIAAFGYTAGLNTKGKGEAMMMYDYSQTQTLNGFYAEDNTLTGKDVPETYYFAPVVTPVSKWDVDGDGTHTDVMRFTESWRSTKTGGLALNGALANNPDKLKAALQLVDYLYSEDGQIVSTYGPMADAQGNGGFWYNSPATEAQISAGNYFTYKGVKYAGTNYKGKTTPTITSKLYDSFKGKEVNNFKLSSNTKISGAALSFTNYARMLIGSTLPVGVKDQSFENQLTALMGQAGAGRVGTGLALGTIKGMTLEVKADNYWFTCVPTGLPIDSNLVSDILGGSDMDHLKQITGTQKANGSKDFLSIFNYIILNGLSGNYNQQDQQYQF